ncbi:LptF/LptG family permease [Blattabacterium cuenoti]|uniref:LptF/LptG family permease n=1 Tax=Blattabacterium cuenoti TaxID=1653831 RepID=UPI00163C4450|nr:LptF/LptG family permease [Blattabacterium cuenoti]
MLIKKLDQYMIRLFIVTFLIVFFITFIIFLIQFFWSQMDELIGKNISIFIIIKFIFYFGISIIPLIIPVSLLLTSIIIYGKFSENQELFAIKSSGISFFRVMKPILWITCILSAGLYFFSDLVIPKVRNKTKKLAYKILLTHSSSFKLREGIFVNLLPNLFIKVENLEDNQQLNNIFIFFYDKNLLNHTIISNKGFFIPNKKKPGFIQIKLINGILYSEDFHKNEEKSYYKIIKFGTVIQDYKIPSYDYENIKDLDDFSYYNIKTLINKINYFKKNRNNSKLWKKNIHTLIKLELELQKRFVFPVACIIMFLIGAPLGSIISSRKGGIWYPTLIAIVIFIFYYTLLTITQNQVYKNELCPWIGAWIPNFIFLPIGIWITYKTVRDDFFFQ